MANRRTWPLAVSGALALGSCGPPAAAESRLDVRNAGKIPVTLTVHGTRITLGPEGRVAGLVYEKGDAVEVFGGKDEKDRRIASRTVLDSGPAFVVLSPDEDGNVGIAESSVPIEVTEKR